jgi:hypothetical protein
VSGMNMDINRHSYLIPANSNAPLAPNPLYSPLKLRGDEGGLQFVYFDFISVWATTILWI